MGKGRSPIQFTTHKLNNHKLSLGAAEEVTYFIDQSGSDSVASPYSIYFDFEREANVVTIRASVACSLTELNGLVQKSPLTINVGTNKIETACTQFKILSTLATVIEVTIR